jgi:hypothetical protein
MTYPEIVKGCLAHRLQLTLTCLFKFILYPEGMNRALVTANWRRVPILLWVVLFISFCLSRYYGIL